MPRESCRERIPQQHRQTSTCLYGVQINNMKKSDDQTSSNRPKITPRQGTSSLGWISISAVNVLNYLNPILSQEEIETVSKMQLGQSGKVFVDYDSNMAGPATRNLFEYLLFVRGVEEDIKRSQKGEGGLSGVLDTLGIVANLIEVGTATGVFSLWIIRKLIRRRHSPNEGREDEENPLIQLYISEVEKICDFFERVNKSRISEISNFTGISKEKLQHMLKGLSFEHEPACFWHPPTIDPLILKNTLKERNSRKK